MENLSDEVGATRAMVFGALTEMLKQESLISSFQGFTELIILKVLEAHRDDEKDVSFLIPRGWCFKFATGLYVTKVNIYSINGRFVAPKLIF